MTQATRSDRAAAFDQWWKLSSLNGTLSDHRKNLAREAYYAAWGGGDNDLMIDKKTADVSRRLKAGVRGRYPDG